MVKVRNRRLRVRAFSGANTSILNEKNQAPIHLMTEMNKVAALEVLSKYRSKIDIQQGGEHGRTALHLAAIYDYEECARILVKCTEIYLNLFFLLHSTPYVHLTYRDSNESSPRDQ